LLLSLTTDALHVAAAVSNNKRVMAGLNHRIAAVETTRGILGIEESYTVSEFTSEDTWIQHGGVQQCYVLYRTVRYLVNIQVLVYSEYENIINAFN